MTPSSEQYAQLAALFTTEAATGFHPKIELLLPGHLPVQGGLWLVPYAGREAGIGTSMLVRMQEETLDVAAIGRGEVDLTACSSIEEIFERVDTPIEHWIVQPPIDADPTSLLHCDADCITLLSGADQAAVVGAYRLLKDLIAAADSDEEFPTIRIVVVGAEEHAANDASARIIHTAHQQLGIQVEVGHPLPAMGSSNNVISQISVTRSSNIVDLFSRIRRGHGSVLEVDQDLGPTAKTTPLPTMSTHSTDAEISDVSDSPTTDTPAVSETPHDEATKVVAPVDAAASAKDAAEDSPSLTSYVDGLLPIAPRCPEREHVELAIDSHGCLHVLAEVTDIRDVAIVTGWAIHHQALLVLACGGVRVDMTVTPVQHIFTSDAASVADLQGGAIRLHLLTEVEVQGNRGLFSTPLN